MASGPYDPSGYNPSDPEVPILVSAELDREVRVKASKFDPANKLTSIKPGGIFQVSDMLTKKAGDTVKYAIKWQNAASVRPIIGDEPAEGRGQGHKTSTYSLSINQSRFVYSSRGAMSQQRVPWNIIDENRDSLSDQLASSQEYAASFHLCGAGNLATLDPTNAYTWHNAPQHPDAEHILYPSGISNDQSLTSNNTLSVVSLINRMVTRAKTLRPRIRPASINGGMYYLFFIHPFVGQKLREEGADWLELYQKVLQGGNWADNPIFSGALGIINNTILVEDPTMTPGVHSTSNAWVHDVRRCVFAGADCLKINFGRGETGSGFGLNRYQFLTHEKDNGNIIENTSVMIGGMGCPRYTRPWDGVTVDYAKIVVPVWAPPDSDALAGEQELWDGFLAQ